jgi:hypothetical protein
MNVNHVFHILLADGPLVDRVRTIVRGQQNSRVLDLIFGPEMIHYLVSYCLDLLCHGVSEHEYAEQTPLERLIDMGLPNAVATDLIDTVYRRLEFDFTAFGIPFVKQRGWMYGSEGFHSSIGYRLLPAMDGFFVIIHPATPPTYTEHDARVYAAVSDIEV